MDATDRSYHKQPIFQNTKATSGYIFRWIPMKTGCRRSKRWFWEGQDGGQGG